MKLNHCFGSHLHLIISTMALSLLRCQRCFFQSSILRSFGKQSGFYQQQSLFITRYFSSCAKWNTNEGQLRFLQVANCQQQPSRQFVLFNRRRRIVRMSPLKWTLLGFSVTTLLIVVESIFNNYRRSGLSLNDMLSWFRSESQTNLPLAIDNAQSSFATKYASLLSESDLPQPPLKPSRIVCINWLPLSLILKTGML